MGKHTYPNHPKVLNPFSFKSFEEFCDYALKRIREFYEKDSLEYKCRDSMPVNEFSQQEQNIESTIDM